MLLTSLAPLAGLLLAALVAVRAKESPVQIVEPPAGPGSGMYALTPQQRPYRSGRFTEDEPLLSWIDPLPEGGHALRFAILQGDRWSEPREVARGTHWFTNWADHPSVVWAGGGDDMLAHWLVRSGNGGSKYGYGVRIARSTDGGRQWTPLFSAEPEDTHDYAGFVAFSTVMPVPGAAYLSPAAGQVAHVSPAPEGHHAEGRKALVYTHFMPDGRAVTDVLDPDTKSGRATGIPQLSRSGSRLVLAWRDERVRTALVPIVAVGLPAPTRAH